MKYLKRIDESFTPDNSGAITYMSGYKIKDMFDSIINWEMVENIKDMALEYLDEGFYLNICIICKKNHLSNDIIYNEHYSHNKEFTNIEWVGMWVKANFEPKEDLVYSFKLHNQIFKSSKNVSYEKLRECIEEFNVRIMEAYPNENIKI